MKNLKKIESNKKNNKKKTTDVQIREIVQENNK